MKALTLWRPWPWAILYPARHLAKNVENRTWAPPKSILGEWIWIHAGKKYDKESAEDIAFETDLDELPSEAKNQGIVGAVVFDRVIRGGILGTGPAQPAGDWAFKSAWYSGPVGWVITKRYLLPEPIPCPGRQGLWTVPDNVAAKVLEQVTP